MSIDHPLGLTAEEVELSRASYSGSSPLEDSLRARITALEAEVARLRGEREAFSDKLDTERYKVAFGVQVILRAVQGRQWLSEPGRGSYTYDDERYQAEFGAALKEIEDALQPLRKIARDFSGCPSDPLRVAANRAAALNERTDV